MASKSRRLPEAWCVVHYADGIEVYGPYSQRDFAIEARLVVINQSGVSRLEGNALRDDVVVSADHDHEFSVVSMNAV